MEYQRSFSFSVSPPLSRDRNPQTNIINRMTTQRMWVIIFSYPIHISKTDQNVPSNILFKKKMKFRLIELISYKTLR